MIKDLSKSLVDAVSAINQKSREAWVAEQAAMKKPKLPGVPAPKADPAAVSSAKKMAEEAGGTTPKTEKEKKLAALANDGKKNVITHADVMAGRGVRKEEKEESAAHEKAEKKGNNPFDWKNFKSGMAKKPGEMTGHDSKKISTGTVFTKKAVKEDTDVDEGFMSTLKKIGQKAVKAVSHGSDEDMIKDLQKKVGVPQTGKKPVKENMDTPGNSTHQCAIHVKSEQFGEGRTLFSQHAEPDADGNIAWYDVMFAEGIKRVETKDIEVLVSEGHMDHKKKKAK